MPTRLGDRVLGWSSVRSAGSPRTSTGRARSSGSPPLSSTSPHSSPLSLSVWPPPGRAWKSDGTRSSCAKATPSRRILGPRPRAGSPAGRRNRHRPPPRRPWPRRGSETLSSTTPTTCPPRWTEPTSSSSPLSGPSTGRPPPRPSWAARPTLCHPAPFRGQRIGLYAKAFQDERRGVSDPLADRRQRSRPDRNRAHGQREHDDQSVPHAAGISWVGHLAQPLQQARDRLGRGPGMLTELVKGRRVWRRCAAAGRAVRGWWACEG
jgi:hypothetical protein